MKDSTINIIHNEPNYKTLLRLKISDLEQGLFDTHPTPKGRFRTAWIMKLRREPSLCKLPRGFGKLSNKHV